MPTSLTRRVDNSSQSWTGSYHKLAEDRVGRETDPESLGMVFIRVPVYVPGEVGYMYARFRHTWCVILDNV